MIYIASPYSHSDPKIVESNFEKVALASAHLCSQGLVAISPIVYGHTIIAFHSMPTDWEFWKSFCLSILDKCEELIVLTIPGWESSRGVREEIEYATKKDLKISYFSLDDLVNIPFSQLSKQI